LRNGKKGKKTEPAANPEDVEIEVAAELQPWLWDILNKALGKGDWSSVDRCDPGLPARVLRTIPNTKV